MTSQSVKDDELLRLASSVEKVSEHPLAQAIVEGAQARKLELAEVKDFEAIPGHGVSAKVEDKQYFDRQSQVDEPREDRAWFTRRKIKITRR